MGTDWEWEWEWGDGCRWETKKTRKKREPTKDLMVREGKGVGAIIIFSKPWKYSMFSTHRYFLFTPSGLVALYYDISLLCRLLKLSYGLWGVRIRSSAAQPKTRRTKEGRQRVLRTALSPSADGID